MKTFKFDFNLSVWIRNLEINAETYEEALKQLNEMTAEEIIENGYAKSHDITDLDYEEEDE